MLSLGRWGFRVYCLPPPYPGRVWGLGFGTTQCPRWVFKIVFSRLMGLLPIIPHWGLRFPDPVTPLRRGHAIHHLLSKVGASWGRCTSRAHCLPPTISFQVLGLPPKPRARILGTHSHDLASLISLWSFKLKFEIARLTSSVPVKLLRFSSWPLIISC